MANSGDQVTIQSDIGASVLQSGRRMARMIAENLDRVIQSRGVAVVILDASPILAECYRQLCEEEEVSWTRVVGFQLSEWRGRAESDPDGGRRMLLDSLVCRVPMAEFHGLRGEAANLAAVCANYQSLLERRPPDLAVVAFGVDGRIGTPPIEDSVVGERVLCQPDSIGLTYGALVECRRIFAVIGEGGRRGEQPFPPCFSLFDRN